MIKRTFLAASLCVASLSAFAQHPDNGFQTGLSYGHLSEDVSGFDIESDMLLFSAGYQFFVNDSQWAITPQVAYGKGVGDVEINGTGVGVDVDNMVWLSVRTSYYLNESFYLFAKPSYAEVTVEGEDGEWEFGTGLGLGNTYRNGVSLELGYDRFDDTNLVNFSLLYQF